MNAAIGPKPSRQKPGTRKTRLETVEGGYEQGFDRVLRVVDTLAAMYRRGQLSKRQWQAAERYREAYEVTKGAGLGSTLDDSRTGGSRGPKASLSSSLVWAAEQMNQVRGLLGRIDGKVIRLVCGEGYSIDQATANLYRVRKTKRGQRDVVAVRLKEGLDTLADAWMGKRREARLRSNRSEDARPRAGRPGKIKMAVQVGVVHASRNGVSNRKKGRNS